MPVQRRSWRAHWTLLGSALLVATCWLVLAVRHGATSPNADFFIFTDSARLFLQGESPYYGSLDGKAGLPVANNLNHPASVLLMVPFALLDPVLGFFLWTVVGAVFAAAAAWVAYRASRVAWTPRRRALAAAAAVLSPGFMYSVHVGQVGLVLALGTALMWALLRRGRYVPAGFLLGIMIVLKPFLLPLAGVFFVRRHMGALVATAAGGVVISAAVLPFMGFDMYAEWISALRAVNWERHAMNASLPGLVHRFADGQLHASVTGVIGVIVTATAAAALFRRPPKWMTSIDRDFSLLLVAGLLASPLGWIYYTPLLIPVAVVLAEGGASFSKRGRQLVTIGAGLLWVPYLIPIAMPHTPLAVALSGVHTYGLVLLFLALGGAVRLCRGTVGDEVNAVGVRARTPGGLSPA